MSYVTRVVMIRFRGAYRELSFVRQVAAAARQAFPRIPGVVSFSAGPTGDKRPDFDLALLVGFDLLEDVEPYRSHPLHTDFIAKHVTPYVDVLEARNFVTG